MTSGGTTTRAVAIEVTAVKNDGRPSDSSNTFVNTATPATDNQRSSGSSVLRAWLMRRNQMAASPPR